MNPEIVLLDVQMPLMNGFESDRRIKHEFPATQILMVSQFESGPFARESIAAGASGFVAKSDVSSALIPALPKIKSLMQPDRETSSRKTRIISSEKKAC